TWAVPCRRLHVGRSTAPPSGCPHRDSNPDWTDFKSAASAGWAMGARGDSTARAVRRCAARHCAAEPGAAEPGAAGSGTAGSGVARHCAATRYASRPRTAARTTGRRRSGDCPASPGRLGRSVSVAGKAHITPVACPRTCMERDAHMSSVILMLIGLALFVLGYLVYSKYLARRVYALNENFTTPAHEMHDGVDYVPTNKYILWGHHFTSVAGAAPIVGPAIAVIWGWLPAFLWVTLGTVFFAGMQDLGTLW